MALTKDLADGVHLVSSAYVNCYLIEDTDGVLLVDTGLPRTWPVLLDALAELDLSPEHLRAVVLTHAHFDHVGNALRAQRQLGLDVWAHAGDHQLAAHPYHYAHERPRVLYPIRYPRGIRVLTTMAAAGALRVPGVRDVRAMAPDAVLDVPGRPRVVFTPGHTFGHCALHFPERDVLVTGDALVTLDPYTLQTGPQIVSRAATADSQQALASLAALAETGAGLVLPGHGEPWRGGIQAAVTAAGHRPVR